NNPTVLIQCGQNAVRQEYAGEEIDILIGGMETGYIWQRVSTRTPQHRGARRGGLRPNLLNRPGARHVSASREHCPQAGQSRWPGAALPQPKADDFDSAPGEINPHYV